VSYVYQLSERALSGLGRTQPWLQEETLDELELLTADPLRPADGSARQSLVTSCETADRSVSTSSSRSSPIGPQRYSASVTLARVFCGGDGRRPADLGPELRFDSARRSGRELQVKSSGVAEASAYAKMDKWTGPQDDPRRSNFA